MRPAHIVTLTIAALGCTIDDTQFVGACTPDGDAVRVVAERGAFSPQPGLIDGQLLLAWVVAATDGAFDVHAAWFAPDLTLGSALSPFGRQQAVGFRMVWAREGNALVAQGLIGTDAMGRLPIRAEDALRIVRVATSGAPSVSSVTLPISTDYSGCAACSNLNLGGAFLDGGADSRNPALAVSGRVVMEADAEPRVCVPSFVNTFEPLLFTATTAVFAQTRPFLCHQNAQDYPNNIDLVRGAGNSIGILFRVGESEGLGVTHYMMSDVMGHPVGPPVRVGAGDAPLTADVGWDLHGVPLGPDGGVLFRERTSGGYGFLTCYRMRAFHGDGSDAADTAFQAGCMRSGRYVTRSMDLVELPNGLAAVVWGERTGYGGLADLQQVITSSTPWSEAILMAIVVPSGRRGSDIVRVTPDQATRLAGARTAMPGPYPSDFVPRAVSEGDRVVVTWRDERADAPGIYARSFHCRATVTDASSVLDAGVVGDTAPADGAP